MTHKGDDPQGRCERDDDSGALGNDSGHAIGHLMHFSKLFTAWKWRITEDVQSDYDTSGAHNYSYHKDFHFPVFGFFIRSTLPQR